MPTPECLEAIESAQIDKKRRVVIDSSINIPTLLTIIGLVLGAYRYYSNDHEDIVRRFANLEAEKRVQDLRDINQDQHQADLVITINKIDNKLDKINEKLDRRGT